MITKRTKKICQTPDMTEIDEHIKTDYIRTFSHPSQIVANYSENTTLEQIAENLPNNSYLLFYTNDANRNYEIEQLTGSRYCTVVIENPINNRTIIRVYDRNNRR